MNHKYEDNWYDIIKRLNEMSNKTPEQERQELLEAARQEPRILDDRDVSLADIAKLAGIKEYSESPQVSKQAEQLIESITSEERAWATKPTAKQPIAEQSIITRTIQESDKNESMGKKMEKAGQKISKRLEQIAELETKIQELKNQEIEENTYDDEKFKSKLRELLEYFLKNASMDQMVDMYKLIADENIKVGEDGRVTIGEIVTEFDKQEDNVAKAKDIAKQYAGDMTKAYDEIEKVQKDLSKDEEVQKALKQHNETTQEASGFEGQDEFHAHQIRLAGDFDPERPVSDADAEAVKQAIIKNSAQQGGRGIVVDVEPAEGSYNSVIVHTMRGRDEILGYLGDMVDEQVINYKDELSENKKSKKKSQKK